MVLTGAGARVGVILRGQGYKEADKQTMFRFEFDSFCHSVLHVAS